MKRAWTFKDDQYVWGIYILRGRLSTDLIFSWGRYRTLIVLKPYKRV